VNLNHEVTAVEPVGDKVRVVINGEARLFDRVLLAMHADQSYRVLKQPTPLQHEMLSKVRYNRCKVVLHTDTSILPADRSRWSSWNYARYEENGKTKTYLVYYMNKVQGLDAQGDYLVSVDCERPIDPAKVIQSFEYEHPIIDMEVYRIQDRIHDLNDEGRIYFSGTYFSIRRAGPDFAGFHESGIQSAQEVVRRLLAAADAREATAAAARSTEAV
jgi:predicted NAD/FAD-binding protein